MPSHAIYLASQSPRRRELLAQIGVRFDVLDVDVAENILPNEIPLDYVQRLARAKAEAGKMLLEASFDKAGKKDLSYWQSRKKHATIAIIIGSDTAVVCGNEILGKPESNEHAARMLRLLSGQTHEVLTGVTVIGSGILTAVSSSLVTFRDLTEQDVSSYIATNEGVDKAGGYAVQGIAAMFIEKLQGSYSGVMGLPLFETANLLKQLGVNIVPRV